MSNVSAYVAKSNNGKMHRFSIERCNAQSLDIQIDMSDMSDMSDINDAFERMKNNHMRCRIVNDMSTLD